MHHSGLHWDTQQFICAVPLAVMPGTELTVSGLDWIRSWCFQIPPVVAFKPLPNDFLFFFLRPVRSSCIKKKRQNHFLILTLANTKTSSLFSHIYFQTRDPVEKPHVIFFFFCFFRLTTLCKSLFYQQEGTSNVMVLIFMSLTALGHSYGKDSNVDRVHNLSPQRHSWFLISLLHHMLV